MLNKKKKIEQKISYPYSKFQNYCAPDLQPTHKNTLAMVFCTYLNLWPIVKGVINVVRKS